MLRQINLPTLTGNAAGTVVSSEPINGILLGVHLATNAGTMTVSTVASPAITILSGTAAGTAWYYPRVQVHSTAGAALTYDGTRTLVEPIPLAGQYVQLASNAAGTADVKLIVQQ